MTAKETIAVRRRRRSLRTLVLAIALAVLVVVTSCAPAPQPETPRSRVERTIRRYNELLTWGYANLDMNRLTEVATPEQAQNEYYHMSALGEGGVKLVAELEDLDFEGVSTEATGATVITSERWSYTQVSLESSRAAASNRVLYRLRYDLEFRSGSWFVWGVTAFESTELPRPDSTLPTNAVPSQRPGNVPQGSLAPSASPKP